MSGTLTIGDFARATHLSVKALRHYHRLGLLVPAEVDQRSGYRHYTVDQIPSAQIVRRFRSLVATQSAVSSLRDLLGPPSEASVELRSVPAMQALAITAVIDITELGAWFRGAFGELDAIVGADGRPPAGPAGALYDTDLFAQGLGAATVFVPIDGPVRVAGRVEPTEVPAADLAVIVHRGDHGDVDRSYGALASFVADHAISLDKPIRETYLSSFRETHDSRRWLTEIGWPIFHPGTSLL